ncbi:hypothetical protein GCM10027091_36530 [Streptomyces daliensis]
MHREGEKREAPGRHRRGPETRFRCTTPELVLFYLSPLKSADEPP